MDHGAAPYVRTPATPSSWKCCAGTTAGASDQDGSDCLWEGALKNCKCDSTAAAMAYLVKKMAALCWLRSCLGAAEMPDVSLVPYQRVAASKLLWVLHKYLIFSCRVLHKYWPCFLKIMMWIPAAVP